MAFLFFKIVRELNDYGHCRTGAQSGHAEVSNNPAGYAAGVASLTGGDLLTSRVWWDK